MAEREKPSMFRVQNVDAEGKPIGKTTVPRKNSSTVGCSTNLRKRGRSSTGGDPDSMRPMVTSNPHPAVSTTPTSMYAAFFLGS